MPNPYFRFKQFTVYHDRCAMKVGTDGVLLGAWADVREAANALDAGTGSGLIALMLAQRNAAMKVTAIDIDGDAIGQTESNVRSSPFSERIECKHISLQDFADSKPTLYDLVVSNPPFFTDSLKSPDRQRTTARHTDTLPVEDLIWLAAKLLSAKGKLCLIYPYEYYERIVDLSEKSGLFVTRITKVYPTPSSAVRRILVELSKAKHRPTESELVIEESRHIYTEEFKRLTKDFYLKM